MSPYSSPLNPIEHLWSAFKTLWRKHIIRVGRDIPMNQIDSTVLKVLESIKITSNILNSCDKAVRRVMKGELV